ncbi:MAG: hypothetical protein ACYTEX_26840 [Planctomycetota bacterium]
MKKENDTERKRVRTAMKVWTLIESIRPTGRVGCPSHLGIDGLRDDSECSRWDDAGACDDECWPRAVLDYLGICQ